MNLLHFFRRKPKPPPVDPRVDFELEFIAHCDVTLADEQPGSTKHFWHSLRKREAEGRLLELQRAAAAREAADATRQAFNQRGKPPAGSDADPTSRWR